MKLTKKRLSSLAVACLLGSATAYGDDVVVSNDISSATTWFSTNTYFLQKVVYVQSNAVLTIEPGTVIKAMTTNLLSSAGVPVDTAALWVQRGGKLYATGTVTSPIIFTYDGDDVNNPNDVPYTTMGKWGGIVLCGQAQINSAADATGNIATPKYEVFEGTTGALEQHRFGGSNDADSSGALKYVSIRYPGIVFAPAKELNGLSLGAVGSGTEIEYVEVFNSADDGFEFFGGNVSTKHLISAFCDDDDFDTDMGYRGTNQFWFGIKPTWTGSTDSRGFETDGDLNQGGYPGNNATPVSSWVVYNATEIGRGTNVAGFGGGVGWQPRDEARPNVYNSIFTDFAEGVRPEVDGTNEFFTGVADLRNTIFFVNTNTTIDTFRFVFNDAARTNTLESALLGGVSYTNNGALNPRPQAGSPALSNVLAPISGIEATSYRGAFAPNDTWANGWTALTTMGFLNTNPVVAPYDPNIIVSSDIVGNVTWAASNTYFLQKVVYVQSNAVLTIEPGTVIKAMTTNLLSSAGVPVDTAALWVQRGGKLYATGTVTSPIIFTYDGDDVNNPNDVPYTTMGKWGGIVLCGQAQINSAADATGNIATPKYEVFEGTTGALEQHRFGGSNDADSSGALKYVSIRYPGIVFAPAKELNGLSLGAVGSGTEIEYVEVFNSADDGFEFFGGNVSTKHLISAFCDDDDFDTDMGYRGTNQFWFGIKPTWTGSTDSRGFETDGDLNQGGYPGNNATPVSSWVVYNATEIGRGTNVAGFGGGVGWQPRDEARPNVYNSIFTDFAEGVRPEVDGTNEFFTGVADLRNTIFFVNTNTTIDTFRFVFNDAARTNTLESALLGGVSYTNNGALNPRPQAGSPALSNVLAPISGIEATSYRGAFAPNDTWANGWTALTTMGFLNTNAVVVVPPTPPTITTVAGSGTMSFSITSQNGYSYLLQATPVLNPPVWATKETLPGNGGALNFTPVPTTNTMEYFRILAQ